MATSVAFIPKNGKSTSFRREKLVQSLYDSLKHRPQALSEAMDLSDTVIALLMPQIKNASLTRNQVAETTHKVLTRFDKPASVSYLAFHPL